MVPQLRILNMNSELVPLDAVRPHPRNPRQGDTGAIHESITANGFYGAVVAQKSTGYILAGNHRHQAAAQAGATEIPVTWVDVDDDHALRILLADNRTNDLASYDDAALAEILKDIHEAHGTLAGTGYDGDALDDLLADLGLSDEPAPAPEAQVDRADELREKWGTELGQLWTIGKHRLLCGDSTSEADVTRLMNGERAGAVITDPPYGIGHEGITNDDAAGLGRLFDGCLAALPANDAVVIAFQSPRMFPAWLDAVRKAGHNFQRALWLHDVNKTGTFPWHGWLLTSDIILVSTIGKPAWADPPPTYAHDCLSTQGREEGVPAGHTTPKPVEVVKNLVSNTQGVVYEPFCGSGTLLAACESLGRTARAIEIEPKYVAVTLERLSGMGLTPELQDA